MPFLFLTLGLLLAACVPAVPQLPAATLVPTQPTRLPTPAPTAAPQPTGENSPAVPAGCQQPGLETYVNASYGYCFAYPDRFQVEKSQDGSPLPLLIGPALDQSLEPVRVSLGIQTLPVPAGSDLARLADLYLAQPQFQDLPWQIQRSTVLLGGLEAVQLDGIPGRLSSRQLLVLHGNRLSTLTFHPVDLDLAGPDLQALYTAVTSSFTFTKPASAPAPAFPPREIRWVEFNHSISLTYDPILAPWVEASTVPAIPSSPQVMFAETHPAYVQFRFTGYQGGRVFQLPYPLQDAQVMVFQTQDFPGFGDEAPNGFIRQQQALSDLLKQGVNPGHCDQPLSGYDQALPFLPWLNSRQAFCAQPEVIQFHGGKGIRYLVHYSQGDGPVLEGQPFYTFQGLTDDGQLYLAAIFPVQTRIFPAQSPDCPKCSDPTYDPRPGWLATLGEQLTKLNAQPAGAFAPSLGLLDALVRSIRVEAP